MAKKDFQGTVKGFMNESTRPSTMQELLSDSGENENTVKSKSVKTENSNNGKSINRETDNPKKSRYELRPDEELDARFRQYMFEKRQKANKTLSAALSQFLKKQGY